VNNSAIRAKKQGEDLAPVNDNSRLNALYLLTDTDGKEYPSSRYPDLYPELWHDTTPSPKTSNVVPLRQKAKPSLSIVRGGDWAKTWTPPKWLVRGLLQQRFVYSLTAPAGFGKTAVALTLAAYVALGRDMGDYSAKAGRVLYLAGENPDDILTRWLVLAEELGVDPADIPVDFLPGVTSIEEVKRMASAREPYSLLIVDTDQAFFDGDDINGNGQRRDWAQKLRTLVDLPGGPSVVILAHPPKDAMRPPFRPYGGNAFLNEVDANVFLAKDGDFILFKRDPDKFRGPDFKAAPFELRPVISTKLADSDGNPVMSVMAVPLTADDYDAQKAKATADDELDTDLMLLLADQPGKSLAFYASELGASKRQVDRRVSKLIEKGFVEKDDKGKSSLTVQGRDALTASNQTGQVE